MNPLHSYTVYTVKPNEFTYMNKIKAISFNVAIFITEWLIFALDVTHKERD